MNKNLEDVYISHHLSRGKGFSIMKAERGEAIKTVIGSGKTVLDIGCRDGALTGFFSSTNKVLGADIDASALQNAHKDLGIETILMDLNGDWEELGNRKFDSVVAGEVLEHLYHPRNVIKKIGERLEKGGVFVGSVPNAFSLKNRLRLLAGKKKNTSLEDPTHINQFHINELREMLRERFADVTVRGLGRHSLLARYLPGMFAFDLFFVAKNPK